MADRKISDLDAISGSSVDVDADYLEIIDTSESSAKRRNKKITPAELVANTSVFTQSGTGAVAEDIQTMGRRIVYAAQYGFKTTASGTVNNTAWKNFLTRLDGSGDIGVINGGTYAMTDGVDPQTYELANCVLICAGEVIINADALTSTNVVLQVGNDFTQIGSLTINVTGTSAGSNGSVRLPITIGRWWDGSEEIRNIAMGQLRLSNSYATANLLTIRGNTSNVEIENVVCSGTYERGLMVHWSDTADDASPTETFHPHNIRIGNVEGEDALAAVVLLSAVYNVKIGRIAGKDNVKGFDCYAGDYGASLATADQASFVGFGIEVGEVSVKNCGTRAVLVNGKPGTSGSNLDMPLVIRGGHSTGDGGSSSDYGIEVLFSKRGEIGPVKMMNFGYGIRMGQGSEGYTLISPNPESNLVSGILCTGSGSDKSTDHMILNPACRLNNTNAAGGVGNIYLAALSEDVTILGGVVERSTADTTSNGVRIDSTTSLRHKIIGLRGKGFDTRSVVSISGPTSAAGIVVRDVTSDDANSSICDSPTLVYSSINASGRRAHPASVNTTAVGNVTTGEDDLQTYSLALDTLQTGDGVHITAWGTTANNANAKTLKLYFGATAILTVSLTTGQAGVWRIEADVFSTGTDAQDYVAQLSETARADVPIAAGSLTENDGAAIVIKCTGEGTGTNDIRQDGLIVKFIN